MQRVLGILVVLAAGLLLVAVTLGAGGTGGAGLSAAPLAGPTITLDTVSFGLGFLGGVVVVWIYRVPWGTLPRLLVGWLLGWRRNFGLTGLAVAFAAVLLFY